jgi:L-threonylcarbamoyladenylate synthase
MNNNIEQAASIIKKGGLVAFPTETVYGLGADATNQEACLNIFKAKGRPSNNPLIVHVHSLEAAMELAEFNASALLLSKFWPGPLSIVLPKKPNAKIVTCVSAGLATIAIRVPADDVALQLLEKSGLPIAAPSANKSGMMSSTAESHVRQNFASEIFVLSSGRKCEVGLESTIVDLSTPIPTILRYGFITPEMVEAALGRRVEVATKSSEIKAPGMMHRHYCPRAGLRRNATSLREGEVGLDFADSNLGGKFSLNLSKSGDLAEAASNLFDYLHQLDEYALEHNMSRIAVAPVPLESIGLAINDRLSRAAQG